MSTSLPIRSPPTSSSRRNQESRNYFTSYTSGAGPGSGSGAKSGAEAINGPVREEGKGGGAAGDRLIVGVDFGTTFSGWVSLVLRWGLLGRSCDETPWLRGCL